MEHLIDIGGRPGIDCHGFCKFCYFKNVSINIKSFGCKYCIPFKKGCYYCTYGIKESSTGFKPLKIVLKETLYKIESNYSNIDYKNKDCFTITGGGDVSCYPHLFELISFLSEFGNPIKIGYTSGKGFQLNDIDFLLKNNICEINYSLFSSDFNLRKQYLNDKNPKTSLKIFEDLCSVCDVYAALLLIKDINDKDKLEKTLDFIEKSKCKGVIIMRFSNKIENGLILNNSPILNNIHCHTIYEFKNIVYNQSIKRKKLRISGTPISDPITGAPFSILNHQIYLNKLPIIYKQATIITGSIASVYLSILFSKIGTNLINVIGVKKEIACLITEEDLNDINLKYVKETVFIPGRCLIHDKIAKNFFCSDGIERIIRRGPDMLTVDGEISISMSTEEVLKFEIKNLSILINHINSIGI